LVGVVVLVAGAIATGRGAPTAPRPPAPTAPKVLVPAPVPAKAQPRPAARATTAPLEVDRVEAVQVVGGQRKAALRLPRMGPRCRRLVGPRASLRSATLVPRQ